MLCYLPSRLKQSKGVQELRLQELETSGKLLSLWKAHSVASIYHSRFCTKARRNNATFSLNSQKELTSGTLLQHLLCEQHHPSYISITRKDLGLGEEHMTVVIFDTFKGHTGSKMESLLLENSIISVIVPSNCTDVLRPLDLSVNKPLKDPL